MMTDTTSNLNVALNLAKSGMYVFPCHAGGDRVKAPITSLVMSWKKQSTNDPVQIGRWWAAHPKAAIGLDLGKSNMIVIDCDRHGADDGVENFGKFVADSGQHFDFDVMAATPNQGTHIFFKMPKDQSHGNGRGGLPAGVDVRGAGGYVIAPGTVMSDGRMYEVFGDITNPPVCPDYIWQTLKAEREKPEPLPHPKQSFEATGHDEIAELLSYISPDIEYNDWISAIMAVHAATGGSQSGLNIVDQWSSAGTKYKGRREIEAKWRSIKSSGINLATLADMAAHNGADLSAIAIKHKGGEWDGDAAHGAEIARKMLESIDGTLHDAETGEIIEYEHHVDAEKGTAHDYFDIPDAMLNPGGVVGEIADWICEWTDAPIRLHAIGVALTAVGTLMGRKVYSKTRPTGTHLYIGAIAPSSVGKQHAQDCAKLLLNSVAGKLYCGWQASGPALANTIHEGAARLMVVDEFADKLQALRGRNASASLTAMSEVFRELWGLSTGSYQAPRALVRSEFETQRPSLSFFGSSTIRDFKENMTAKDVTNGLFNRFLLLPRYGLPDKGEEPEGIMTVPESLLVKCKAIYNCLPQMEVSLATSGDTYPKTPVMVPFTPEAQALNIEAKAYQDDMRRSADDDMPLALYGRYAEQIKRVAMIVACGRHYNNLNMASITADDMTFARNLVTWSMEQFVLMARRDMVENFSQAQYIMVLDIIRSAKSLDRSVLYRKIKGRIKRRDLDDILIGLAQANLIEIQSIETGKKGRPSTRYQYLSG